MTLYGLIGYPLAHSFSAVYFQNKFEREGIIDSEYHLFSLEQITGFPALLKKVKLSGLNVTIPYKTAIIPYLQELDPIARDVEAVNTISIRWDGDVCYTKGFNTDVIGFRNTLTPMLQSHHNRALILGTGGASNAVAYVLRELGIQYEKVGRLATKPGILSYGDLGLDDITGATLIINATPAGMQGCTASYPCVSLIPLLKAGVGPQHILYDLVYNPGTTPFLHLGKEKGAVIKNGLEMLHEQAEAAWKIWSL